MAASGRASVARVGKITVAAISAGEGLRNALVRRI
jgi:hypothetical protein